MRKLVIGDIHSCYDELLELIDKSSLSSDDEIIFLGDFIDRGPEPLKVFDYLINEVNVTALIGNHERKHINSFYGKTRAAISQNITRMQFGENYPEFISHLEKLRNYTETEDAMIVHGFFEPGIPLNEQKDIVIEGRMSGEFYLTEKYNKPWYELYDGEKPIITGHHDYLRNGEPFIVGDKVFCIDTGCCMGGNLTGIILPEFKIISVKSRNNYWSETKKKFGVFVTAEDKLKNKIKIINWETANKYLEGYHNSEFVPDKIKPYLELLERFIQESEFAVLKLLNYSIAGKEMLMSEIESESGINEILNIRASFANKVKAQKHSKLLYLAFDNKIDANSIKKIFTVPFKILKTCSELGLMESETLEELNG
jgi:serine/threonine protein phosphatase 1